jgi:gamma-glutamyltranspeptidase/glutathione hydrolase
MGLDMTRRAPHGMVSSVDHLATEAGVAMLRAGGSAADAVVATSAVLAVTAPHLCGLGGDLFALVHTGPGAPACLNASGRAGSGADPARLRDEGHRSMPFRGDVRSAPVPGCVDGWLALHARFGRLPLDDVLAPAIDYAERGFPAAPLLSLACLMLAGVPGAGDLNSPSPATGDRVTRPGVARALRAITAGGRGAFYEGEFGEALLEVGSRDGAPEYHADDLQQPLADWVDPLVVRTLGHDVWTVPANSQGYLTLLGLAIAEGLDLPDDPAHGAWAHLLVESARAAAHDRGAMLFEGADLGPRLVDAEVARRRGGIDPERRTALPGHGAQGDTMFCCAADADGNGVSLIQSNASGFGCHVAVGDTGILLHNRGIGFNLVPGHPAEYGPRRRPPHTLSPALVTRPDGTLAALVGTMGGDSQPQVLLQLITRVLRHGVSPADALAADRWVLRGGNDAGFDTWDDVATQDVVVEGRRNDAWVDGLRARGHSVITEPPGPRFGHAHLITSTPFGWAGAADPRAEVGAAGGY